MRPYFLMKWRSSLHDLVSLRSSWLRYVWFLVIGFELLTETFESVSLLTFFKEILLADFSFSLLIDDIDLLLFLIVTTPLELCKSSLNMSGFRVLILVRIWYLSRRWWRISWARRLDAQSATRVKCKMFSKKGTLVKALNSCVGRNFVHISCRHSKYLTRRWFCCWSLAICCEAGTLI